MRQHVHHARRFDRIACARIACVGVSALAALVGACASSRPPTTAAAPIAPVAVAPSAPPPALPPLPDDGRPGDPAPRALDSAAVAPPSAPSLHVLLADEPPAYSGPPALGAEGSPHRRAHGRGRNGRPYHPGPRIVLDVSGGEAPAFASDVQRTWRNLGYWPVRRCYEGGLRRDQRLAGKVSLELSFDGTGASTRSVLRASAVGSTLSDPVVVACVSRELAEFSLSPAPAQASATWLVDVSLSTGDEPVGLAPPLQDAAHLREALQASWPDVERCYEQALSADRGAGGRLELDFRVSADGTVATVEEGEPRFGASAVTQCVLAVYRAVRLPAGSSARGERAFVYGLQLESAPLGSRQATARAETPL